MKKIKYQGWLTKVIAAKLGISNKAQFAKYIDKNLPSFRNELSSGSSMLSVVSFSCSNDFYDQILSILTFLKYVGTPVSWTIYSDGSHTPQQIQLLNSGFEFINIVMINWGDIKSLDKLCKENLLAYKDDLLAYAKNQPLGKKLYLYLNHDICRPTLFLDSDILFYHKASVLDSILQEDVHGWYLPDTNWGCLDSRYKEKYTRQLYQVNSGFILFNKNLVNVSEGLMFLKSLNFEYEYFSEQTIIHILLRANKFMPLDPRLFVINTGDQFDLSYLYTRENIALRHYSGPVRHKMWQNNWKWQLSLI